MPYPKLRNKKKRLMELTLIVCSEHLEQQRWLQSVNKNMFGCSTSNLFERHMQHFWDYVLSHVLVFANVSRPSILQLHKLVTFRHSTLFHFSRFWWRPELSFFFSWLWMECKCHICKKVSWNAEYHRLL